MQANAQDFITISGMAPLEAFNQEYARLLPQL